MERYAEVMRKLQLVHHAIEHTYDAAYDECMLLESAKPNQYYLDALRNLVEHQNELRNELEFIRQQEIIEDEVLQITLLSLRLERLKEWLSE